jgi:hypothetical protein
MGQEFREENMKAIAPFIIATALFAQNANAKDPGGLPRQRIVEELSRVDCPMPPREAIESAEVYPIEASINLVIVTCVLGNDNVSSIVFQVDQTRPDDAKLLELLDWSYNHNRWEKTNLLFNVQYEPKTKLIVIEEHYRAMADCGSSGHYAWSDGEFRLIGYWRKPKCDHVSFEPGGAKWRVPFPH